MPRHSDRPPLARPRSGGLRNVICVSITSLRTRALAFLASFVSFVFFSRPRRSSLSLFLSLSRYFRSSCIVSLASLATLSRPFSSSIRSRPPLAVVEGNLGVSARRCSKTFMYLLSDDNKRRCGARSAGVMSLARISRDGVAADKSR